MQQPQHFLEVRVHDLQAEPTLSGLCVGYELGEWRAKQFADHVIQWLPEFALTHTEIETLSVANMISLATQAARKVHGSSNATTRGEFGELFLHIAMRQVFGSEPAISKIYYKSARNDTVKGFDAVHVVSVNNELELWLGEAKFYKDITDAMRDVVNEIGAHTARDYLRDEFLMIRGKISEDWIYAEQLKQLLADSKSLDDIFKRIHIPILLTYDSDCVASHNECSEEYIRAFCEEIWRHHQTFSGKSLPSKLRIHLFLLPLGTKDVLLTELENRLRGLQG